MLQTANLGYPRIGAKRELKRALEKYWKGQSVQSELLQVASEIRQSSWRLQHSTGIDMIPSNDFSLYDHVLDTACMVGAVPERYGWNGDTIDLETYFSMARGKQAKGVDLPAMEMTKWFDTNYHYIVPEFWEGQTFKLATTKVIDEYLEAQALGIHTRPVLLGPVSFLMLGKSNSPLFDPLELLQKLLVVYEQVLQKLVQAGSEWVQIDEPFLAMDLSEEQKAAYRSAYQVLSAASNLKIHLTTYFEGLRDNIPLVCSLPVDGLHIDLVRAPDQLKDVLAALPERMGLSLGLVDGRNVWRTQLDGALAAIQCARETLSDDRILIAPSCSLLFCPYDLDQEKEMDMELRSWLAFAKQKIEELLLLKRAADQLEPDVKDQLARYRSIAENRRLSSRTHSPAVRDRLAGITPQMLQREKPFPDRKRMQTQSISLPEFPTTTIGSFPQTQEVRAQRAAFRRGEISQAQYESFLQAEIEKTIRFQEEIGLDVLVHGEQERTDMVEYFGEQLTGIAFSQNGWVQSYGSRCVRPPIIYGDVARPKPMTVRWSAFAQSLTNKPVKGMLTGPITILQWSFVRDDQARADTCRQIALAIRDEVLDLEANGIQIIQIDEPAMREGLPLRREDWNVYLHWAVECFRLASSGVKDSTQIHTHMCYAEFNDIIEAIGELDADVISIEASRSRMELLDAFQKYHYPNDIGPGVYDIHSPRVPSQEEMETLLQSALGVIGSEQLWVNPDCGLKTRSWAEAVPALQNMVAAARSLRKK